MRKKINILIITVIIAFTTLATDSFAENLKENLFDKAKQNNWKIFIGDQKMLYALDFNGARTPIFSEKENYHRLNYFSLSPDGKKVAFHEMVGSEKGFKEYLTVANIDGGNKERLLEIRVDIQGIRNIIWSPINEDGIAFLSDYKFDSESYSLYLFNVRNKSKQIIVKDLVSGLGIPVFSWSPDGMRIVFTSTEGKIMIVNKDGSGLRRICDDDGTVPAWSPDGKTIAYRQGKNYVRKLNDGSLEYGRRGSGKYYIIDVHTKNKKEIWRNKMFSISPLNISAQPVWSPDSEYFLLYKLYDVGFKPDFWIVNVEKKTIIHRFKAEGRPNSISWMQITNLK
jgi:Tol biopolymer transport system component